MRLRRGLLAACSAVLVTATGCASFAESGQEGDTSAASATATEAPVDEIDWTDCTSQLESLIKKGTPGADRDLTFECGRTEVPIDYDEPTGDTLPLFLVRATLGDPKDSIGSLVVNPGGPGASAADFAISQALTLPEDVLEKFQVVGFDPRGVGLSTPVECIPADLKAELFAAEPRPTSAEDVDAAFALADEVATGCEDEYGDALGIFNTVDTARDMDRLREALGDEQLTYLGYSYGTTLGSTYAELFPDKVRALVLDAVVDPDGTPQEDAEQSAASLEAGFDAFGVNCVGLIAGCPLGGDPRGFVEALLAQAEQTPIPSSEPDQEGETRLATPGVVLTAILSALYDTASWPQLAQALAAGQQGDSAGLFSLADSYAGRLEDGSYSNLLDANIAINCADSDPDRTVDEDEVRALAAEWHAKYPFFGAGSATGLYTCSVWEAERTPLPERDAAGSKAILVVGNAGDPVTPLPGAVDMAEQLDNGHLLVWQGQGHTAYPKTDCVNANVNAYLIGLTPPVDGLTCPA
jgi:pimeloyl-ACP methyl ester carboxylesterase